MTSWPRTRLLTLGLALALLLAGITALLLGSVSLEALRQWATHIRRSDDVTPERFARYRHICLLFGFGGLAAGAVMLWRRSRVESFLSELGRSFSRTDSDEADPRSFPREWWALGIVLLGGAALRLALLNQPMAYDEAYSYRSFARHSLVEAIGEHNSANNHLLNTLGMFVTSRLFGPQEWALRLPVLCCGLALLPAVYFWVRRQVGGPIAMMATALVAVAPLMISYSVDARGYSYVALAAVLLDDALRRIDRGEGNSARSWVVAGLSVTFGMWALILMAFPILGTTLWYVAIPIVRRDPEAWRRAVRRFGEMILLGGMTLLPILSLYAPGYIIRGWQLFRDPVIGDVARSGLSAVAQDWIAAWAWWTAGFPTPAAWGLSCVLGALAFFSFIRRGEWFRWSAPFLVMFLVNFLRGHHPPPRTFMWLMPWVALLAAQGIGIACLASRDSIFRERRGWGGYTLSEGVVAGLSLASVLGGIGMLSTIWPVIFFPSERRNFVSVPDVVGQIVEETSKSPTAANRVLAPLPCDLPALFYLGRQNLDWPVNGNPLPDETVWLITRSGQPPETTLRDGLVQIDPDKTNFEPWQAIWKFKTLDLYRSRLISRKERN
jgi:hypothetical protein